MEKKFYSGCFRQVFFSFGGQKKWLLVLLDRGSSYTVTIVWELAWADSALVILDEWLSYRDGQASRFDSILLCLLIKLLTFFKLIYYIPKMLN